MRWRYRLDVDFHGDAPELAGVSFANDWLRIEARRVFVCTGYAWDGCSPSVRLAGGLWLGTWDGPRGNDGRPVSWQASLVHDALCQFRGEIQGLGKAASVRLFGRLLTDAGAPGWMCRLYPWAVSRFGPQDWRVT